MKISALIAELQRLNYEYFCAMKEVTPMGQVPDEPEIYIDFFQLEPGRGFQYKGLGRDIEVRLDLCTGIVIEQKDLFDVSLPDRLKGS